MSGQTSEVGQKRKASALAPPKLTLIDGLSLTWEEREGGKLSVTFTYVKADLLAITKPWERAEVEKHYRGICSSSYDWRSAPGFFSFGPPGHTGPGRAILSEELKDGLTPLGDCSYFSTPTGHTYTTTFAMAPGTVLDKRGPFGSYGAFGWVKATHEAEQVPKALAALLDVCGGSLDVDLTYVQVSNKATYADFKVTTPGGSIFKVESREGGVFDDGVEAKVREDPLGFLRRLVELGADEKSSMDCRVTLPTRGEDLKFSHTTSKEDPRVKLGEVWSKCSFEILEPSKGSTKGGTFTCSA